MDVEFSEWPAFYHMLRAGLLKNIRQLAMEIHTPEMDIHTRPEHTCTWSTKETLAFMLKVMMEVKNAGFKTYYSRTNHRTMFVSKLTGAERYCCINVHMLNVNHPDNAWIPPPGRQ